MYAFGPAPPPLCLNASIYDVALRLKVSKALDDKIKTKLTTLADLSRCLVVPRTNLWSLMPARLNLLIKKGLYSHQIIWFWIILIFIVRMLCKLATPYRYNADPSYRLNGCKSTW